MNTAILGIGSNSQQKKNIQKANSSLTAAFPNTRFSEAIYTEPINFGSERFLNQVAIIKTELSQTETTAFLKKIEKEIGRTPEGKAANIIAIDIDLLQWNASILKPRDMQLPYTKQLINSLIK